MTAGERARVEEMVAEALSAMELAGGEDVSPKEVLMAACTVASRTIEAALRHHPELAEVAYRAVLVLMIECSTGKPN